MLRMLRDNVVMPMLGRIGTAVSVGLVGYGLGVEHVQVVETAIALLLGVGFDLVTSSIGRVLHERKILDGWKVGNGLGQ